MENVLRIYVRVRHVFSFGCLVFYINVKNRVNAQKRKKSGTHFDVIHVSTFSIVISPEKMVMCVKDFPFNEDQGLEDRVV